MISFNNSTIHRREDSLEEFLQSEAILDEVPIRIWHVSDPHFGALRRISISNMMSAFPGLRYHNDDIWNAVSIIRMRESLPDCLVVSGDITSMGTRSSFSFARDRVMRLANELGVPDNNLVIVPGNHDRFCGYFFPLLPQWLRLFERVFGDLCVPRVVSIGARRVLLYPFDSTEKGFRLWPFFANTGVITRKQFNEFNTWMGDIERQSDDVVVVILHHHPLPVPEVEMEGLTVMKNGGLFMAHMQQLAVDLVLHGHMHHSYSCRISYREEAKDTVISAAGTACQGGTGRCSVSIIEFYPLERIVIRVYRYSDTGFYLDENRGRVFRVLL